jgi:magnesium chelatase subunit I
MTDNTPSDPSQVEENPIRSLKELLDMASGVTASKSDVQEDLGFAEILPFPFLGVVGQKEMKLALLLALINPAIGGVLLIGPRGTGKTTAVRGLVDLLPEIKRSACAYGCLPEDIEEGGIDAVCPDCAKKYAEGKPLTRSDTVHIIELPLNARLEDVIGGLDERAMSHERMRLRRGILSQADLNILYVDEVNLLADDIIDALLDASAQGSYTVRRGAISATYRSRFTLIGSMNPEEGALRSQIMDRFGLRIFATGLSNAEDRKLAYDRTHQYRMSPHRLIQQFINDTIVARQEIQAARDLLPKVTLPLEVADRGVHLIQKLGIDSLRAEITLFEAAKGYASADARTQVELSDLIEVAPMALRLRNSDFLLNFFEKSRTEEDLLKSNIHSILK